MASRAKEVHRLLRVIDSMSDKQARVTEWDDEELSQLTVEITPNSGPYHGGKFIFEIELSETYPQSEAPTVICTTPIYHPNITDTVCVSLLNDWQPESGLDDLVQALLFLFYNPNLSDPLSNRFYDYQDLDSMYDEDTEEYIGYDYNNKVFEDFNRAVQTSLQTGNMNPLNDQNNSSDYDEPNWHLDEVTANATADIQSESCNETADIQTVSCNETADIQSVSCNETADIQSESSNETADVQSESSNETADIQSESCNETADIQTVSCNETADIQSESCNETADIQSESCNKTTPIANVPINLKKATTKLRRAISTDDTMNKKRLVNTISRSYSLSSYMLTCDENVNDSVVKILSDSDQWSECDRSVNQLNGAFSNNNDTSPENQDVGAVSKVETQSPVEDLSLSCDSECSKSTNSVSVKLKESYWVLTEPTRLYFYTFGSSFLESIVCYCFHLVHSIYSRSR